MEIRMEQKLEQSRKSEAREMEQKGKMKTKPQKQWWEPPVSGHGICVISVKRLTVFLSDSHTLNALCACACTFHYIVQGLQSTQAHTFIPFTSLYLQQTLLHVHLQQITQHYMSTATWYHHVLKENRLPYFIKCLLHQQILGFLVEHM